MAKPNLVFKQIRESLNLSQEDFGKRLALTQSSVSQIESGARGVERLALRVAEEFSVEMAALGVTIKDLLRGERPISDSTDGASAA